MHSRVLNKTGIQFSIAAVLLFFSINISNAAQYRSNVSDSGSWSSAGSWERKPLFGGWGPAASAPPTSGNFADAVEIRAGDTISVSGSLSFAIFNSLTVNGVLDVAGDIDLQSINGITINGSLVVGGDVNSGDLAALTINSGGAFDIGGDFTANDDNLITVDGDMNVAGDFVAGDNLNLDVDGSLDVGDSLQFSTGAITGVTGGITVGGGLDIPSGSDPDLVIDTDPLPVELISFDAVALAGEIEVHWETASEVDNDFFVLERSTDGRGFIEIARINGYGTTDERKTYMFVDRNPSQGINYYRLTQTDFDGTSETFRMIAVQFAGILKLKMQIYPNPVVGNHANITLNGIRLDDPVSVSILNLSGRIISSEVYSQAGNLVRDGIAVPHVQRGYYIMTIVQGELQLKQRFYMN